MEVVGFVALFAVMCGVLVEAGKLENFVVNVEKITKINDECKETVEKHAQVVANLTDKIQTLEAKNVELEAKNEALNSTLTAIQGKVYHLVNAGIHLMWDAVVDHCLPFGIVVYGTGSPILLMIEDGQDEQICIKMCLASVL